MRVGYVTDEAESILFFQMVHPVTGEVWGDGLPLGDLRSIAADNAWEYARWGITATTDKLVPEICAYSHPPGGPLPAELLEQWDEAWNEAYNEALREIEIAEYEEQMRWR